MKRDVEDAAAEWDREAKSTKLEAAAEQRQRIITAFPATAWPDLPLERYALGLGDDTTYSYLLEYGSRDIGSIKGGSARKHLIYRRSTDSSWYFDTRYADEQQAWAAIREGFVSLLQACSEERWAEIDAIEALLGGPTVRGKTAWIYYPDKFLPIYAEKHLDHFLSVLDAKPGTLGVVEKNRRLLEQTQALDCFGGWSPLEIMYFLYDWAPPTTGHQIMKIAPGEQARFWDECRDGGFICVGWDEVGDLSDYPDKESFRAAFADAFPNNESQVTRKSNELWRLMELEPGDIVVANRGTAAVVGIGKVNDTGYTFRPERPEYKHTLGIDWFNTDEHEIEPIKSWAMVTVAPVKPADYAAITGANSAAPTPVTPHDVIHDRLAELLEHRRQVILYGPPGTGKTWHARRHAVWMLATGDPDEPDEAEKALSDPEQFHITEQRFEQSETYARPAWLAVANPQNWSWDLMFEHGYVDYQHGKIAENYGEAALGDLVFGYQATPDKKLMALATVSDEFDDEVDGGTIWFEPLLALDDGLTYEDLKSDPVLAASQPLSHRMQGTFFRLEDHEAEHLLDQLRKRNDGVPTYDAWATEDGPQLSRVTFHPSYSYEDFVEGYRPVEGADGLTLELRDGIFKRICRTAARWPEYPYVLIIDEINRGNVPKIFGELITLLEKDKRGVTVTLPQSGEEFFVPENVYVIGTMNTADRSIHLLDAALRRRFSFFELMPDSALLAGATVGSLRLDEFLDELNARVRERVGREKQIGHALLLDEGDPITKVDTFASRFRYELLPLVQEYTFGDYADLAYFFGDEIIDVDEQQPNHELLDDPASLVEALANHLRGGA